MKFENFVKNLDIIDIQPKECIVFRFPMEEYDMETISNMHKNLVEKFPNNTVLTIPQDCYLEALPKERMLKFLEDIRKVIEEEEDNDK